MSVRDPVVSWIGLGANLGDPVWAVRKAVQALAAEPAITVCRVSSLYRSAPVDAGGPWFCNAVAEVSTSLAAPALLDVLHDIERQAGRERPYRNAPRTLDLDILRYGDGRIDSSRLTIPHPRMWQRAFVLRPLAELLPSLVSPQALAAVQDQPIERMAA